MPSVSTINSRPIEKEGSITTSDFEDKMEMCHLEDPTSRPSKRRQKKELTLEERREANRLAAEKSRKKVKEQIADLETRLLEIQSENQRLRSYIDKIDQKNDILINLLEERGFRVPESMKISSLANIKSQITPNPAPYIRRRPYERDHPSLSQQGSNVSFKNEIQSPSYQASYSPQDRHQTSYSPQTQPSVLPHSLPSMHDYSPQMDAQQTTHFFYNSPTYMAQNPVRTSFSEHQHDLQEKWPKSKRSIMRPKAIALDVTQQTNNWFFFLPEMQEQLISPSLNTPVPTYGF